MHDEESPENLPAAPVVQPAKEHSYAVFKNADFTRYLIGRFVASLGQQMLVVAIDWELYERTNSALPLAFVGLTQMIPMLLLTLRGKTTLTGTAALVQSVAREGLKNEDQASEAEPPASVGPPASAGPPASW